VLALGALALAPLQAVSAANRKIDPARTHISFAIDAVGYPPTQGEFLRFNGRISMDLEHTGRSSVAFRVQSQSVDVGSSSFDDYWRSVAFLDAARCWVKFSPSGRRPTLRERAIEEKIVERLAVSLAEEEDKATAGESKAAAAKTER
jgi:YceI-like domain